MQSRKEKKPVISKTQIEMAAAILVTLIVGVLLFCKHWRFELPFYPNVDEQLSLDSIYNLMNQHIYAGDIYVLDFFRYPHLTFYYALVGVRFLGKLLAGTDTTILLRYLICGTALLSNVCVYFTVKIMTGSRKWGFVGFLLSVFSLYGYAYLYYTGPDTMIYAIANVIVLLGCLIYQDVQEERVVYLWYPLMAICIGLAMAAKYHGILFGVFWLALHIEKKNWKSYRDNFLFFLNCIVLALVFCVCNYSLFFHFKTFVWDNLYNLQHYAWGHPGIEHNMPLLGYIEAYVFTGYGVVGGLLLILGIVYLIRKKDWHQLVVFLIMPVFIILFLSRYQIMLGRNMSLAVPYVFLFVVYGLMETEALVKKYCFDRHKKSGKSAKKIRITEQTIVFTVIGLMCICNVLVVCNNYRYDLTYTQAESYISEKIPEGSTIYCTSFAPRMEDGKYEVIDIGEDISLLPEQLGVGEYYIDVQYATAHYTQKKDYLIMQGGDMYPEQKKAYEDKIGKYDLLQQFQGISYGKEWKYRVGYLDFIKYSPKDYYVGPSIMIYGK